MNKKNKIVSLRFLLFFFLAITSLVWVFYNGNIQANRKIVFSNKVVFQEESSSSRKLDNIPLEKRMQYKDSCISVTTDKLRVDVNENSGDISNVYLRNYPIHTRDCFSFKKGKISFPILFSNDCKVNSVRSGIFGENIVFHLKKVSQSRGFCRKVFIVFEGLSQNGLHVEKKYTFSPNNYAIKAQISCFNKSNICISPLIYHEFYRSGTNRNLNSDAYNYDGYSMYNNKGIYTRIPIKSINGMGNTGAISKGWIADQSASFMAAWVPRDSMIKRFYIRHVEPLYIFGYTNKQIAIKPGKYIKIKSDLYTGPMDSRDLFDARGKLEGAYLVKPLSISSRIALNLFQEINSLINNWPLSIILSVILVRTLLYPLQEIREFAFFRMTQKSTSASTTIKKLQEKYKENPDVLAKKLSGIYKKEGINQVPGLITNVLQYPVIYALSYAIGSDVDFNGAHFMWMNSLIGSDPYYIMPFFVFLSNILQPLVQDIYIDDNDDKSKQKIKYIPLLFMGAFFLKSPIWFDIYIISTNTILTMQKIHAFRKYSASQEGNIVTEKNLR